jgi:hypothetical protein
MRRSLILALPLAVAVALPATAAADELTIRSDTGAALTGDTLRVRGEVYPYVPGQFVTVRAHREGRRVFARRIAVPPGGRFRLQVPAGARPGSLVLSGSHRRTPEQGRMLAPPQRVDVLPRSVRPGARGRGVRALQARLDRLGYVVGRRGLYDARTARAVLAFRKVTGMRRTSVADRGVMRRLARGGGRFRVRFPQHGRHVEADLSRQVLALIGPNGRVERIYPTSSGAPATPTVRGSFRFYRSQPGTNALGMVHSQYFIRGYAIHGYRSVPVYPASHGCLRVPVPDALSIFRWIRRGDRIDVYA